MIGIIVWLVMIFVIVSLACPGYLTFLFCVALPIGVVLYILLEWIKDKLGF